MSASGSSASRKSSWATIRLADDASTSVPRKTIRSRSSREKMSKERSKRPSDSTTIGTRWFDTLLIGCTLHATVWLRVTRGGGYGGRAGDRRAGGTRRSVGGADGARAARGVVRAGGRARRARGRRGRLPLGRRRRAASGRARARRGGAARPRVGRGRQRRHRAPAGRERDTRAGGRVLAPVQPGARAARFAGIVGAQAADA